MILWGGAFKGTSMDLSLSLEIPLNSPYFLNFLIVNIGFLGFLIIPTLFGQSINKDFETGFDKILFSTPLNKKTYFLVRYLGSLFSTLIILSSLGLGAWFATKMPFIDSELLIENKLIFYLMPYLTILVPNIIIFGSIFIAIVAIAKKIAPVYVMSILLFGGFLITRVLQIDIDYKLLNALLDPFGYAATTEITSYWSIAQKNIQLVTLESYLLYNRILWGAVALIFVFTGYFFFDPFKDPKLKKIKDEIKDVFPSLSVKETQASMTPNSWVVFIKMTILNFKLAFSNLYFLLFLPFAALFILIGNSFTGKMYETEVLPVTYHLFECIGYLFQLFIIFLISFYAGELIWRDREQNFNELVDSKPISNSYLYFSKLLCLVLLQCILFSVILISSVSIQIFNKYYFFEWGVYAKLLTLLFIPHLFISVFALFIHNFSKSKQIGHLFVVLFYVLIAVLPSLGLDHKLYLIGDFPLITYSDMNGFGELFKSVLAFLIYWGLFHLGLGYLTILAWSRGTSITWKARFRKLKEQFTSFHRFAFPGVLCAWIAMGGFIYYNTNVLNNYQMKVTMEKEQVDYELNYRHWSQITQPKVISSKLEVDFFPEKAGMEARGTFEYKNESEEPIKKLFLFVPNEESNTHFLSWNKPFALIQDDPRLGVKIYEFEDPILPNEKVELSFALDVIPRGFKNASASTQIVRNGSFFYTEHYFPTLGYQPLYELSNAKSRKKYHLPEKTGIPSIDNEEALKCNFISREGCWIDFEAIVSTSTNQTAIAPGRLVKKWSEGERNFYHYKMDKPILNFYAFLSGEYALAEDQYEGIKIEIYHHPQHNTNVPRMIETVKKSLEYFTTNFSPYQFDQIRIIEFPRYRMFAQSFPNTIPFSEALGFIAKFKEKDPTAIDSTFYVTSHEVAHQWWGHQVSGANLQGASMLSESLAQYSALMVQEKEYGPLQMKKFLKYERDGYLGGRGSEPTKELPLMLNENQDYICYKKGSLIFYALRDYLGEATVNQVLKDLIQKFSFQSAPFARSIDLVELFKAAAPEDKKYLIEDFFETITFHHHSTDEAIFNENNGKYDVDITTDSHKFRLDGLGKEEEISMNDYVDIGIFGKKGEIIYLEKHKVQGGENHFTISVDQVPAEVGIDPFNRLIDKDTKDHMRKVTKK